MPEIRNASNAKELLIDKGDISFENVNFNYDKDGVNVLNSINLKILAKK